MTKEEAIYWKKFILHVIEERLPKMKLSDLDAYNISKFAEHHMQTITGQQMLPQGTFRKFLELFGKIPAIQEEIIRAQQKIKFDQMMIGKFLHNLPQPANKREVEQIFDGIMWSYEHMWLPSMWIDEDGYGVLNIIVDEEGYAHFLDEAYDEIIDGLMYDKRYMWLPSYNLMDIHGYVPLQMVVDENGYGHFIN